MNLPLGFESVISEGYRELSAVKITDSIEDGFFALGIVVEILF